jgi:hypothetical protein
VFESISGPDDYNLFLFKDKAGGNENFARPTARVRTGRAPSSATVYLQAYNHTMQGWVTLDSNSTAAKHEEFVLTGRVEAADYFDNGYVSCRVYQFRG